MPGLADAWPARSSRTPVKGVIPPASGAMERRDITARGEGWTAGLTVWSSAGQPGKASGDQELIACFGPLLRVAAIDGVTTTASTPATAGVDGAVWAAGATATALRLPRDAGECFTAVNAELHMPGVAGRDQRAACVSCADVHVTSRVVRLVRAGDCGAFVRVGGQWVDVFPQPMLETAADARMRCWDTEHPEATVTERQDVERKVLESRRAWRTTPVGRFARMRYESALCEGVEAVVVATDGARCTVETVGRLDAWMDEVRAVEAANARSTGGRGPHDDLLVVRLQLG